MFSKKILAIENDQSAFKASKRITHKTPNFLVKPLMNLYSFFAYNLNVNLKIFNMPKDAFGSVMVTAVGSLGISSAICPIAPYTRVPMVISIGKIEDRPVVIDKKVGIRKMATFGFTFDHRIMEGFHFSILLEHFKSCFENPKLLL